MAMIFGAVISLLFYQNVAFKCIGTDTRFKFRELTQAGNDPIQKYHCQ